MASPSSPWHRVVVLRHAQSVNVVQWLKRREEGIGVTVPDAEDHLTGTGRRQAGMTGRALAHVLKRAPHGDKGQYTLVKLLTSPSTRSRETAAIVAEELVQYKLTVAPEVEVHADLCELDSHEYVRDPSVTVCGTRDAHLAAWQARVFDCSAEPPTTVRVIVTHGNILRTALAQRWSWSSDLAVAPPLASITTLDVNATDGKTVIHNLCDSSHAEGTVRQWFNEDLFK